jgi:biotin carboxyl carrier protein
VGEFGEGDVQRLLALVRASGIAHFELLAATVVLRLNASLDNPGPASSVKDETTRILVRSPSVGTVHWRDEPMDPAGGHRVLAEGTVLGDIEVLGERREVVMPIGGSVSELTVASGAFVEYGQTLAVLRRQ